MDKIKTIVIEDGRLIQDSGITLLTDDYIELIPDNYISRYLKLNITYKNWIPKTNVVANVATDETTIVDNPSSEEADNTTNNIVEETVNETRYPFVMINGELCPIMIQEDFEIKSEDRFQIESLKINRDIGLGNITMILVSYGKNKGGI